MFIKRMGHDQIGFDYVEMDEHMFTNRLNKTNEIKRYPDVWRKPNIMLMKNDGEMIEMMVIAEDCHVYRLLRSHGIKMFFSLSDYYPILYRLGYLTQCRYNYRDTIIMRSDN